MIAWMHGMPMTKICPKNAKAGRKPPREPIKKKLFANVIILSKKIDLIFTDIYLNMLRILHTNNSLPYSWLVDPNSEFEPGMIAQLKFMAIKLFAVSPMD